MFGSNKYDRGSEWRQWDLHIHTPASYHWSGRKLEPDLYSPLNTGLIDEMINALNNAEPAVFAIMDYWTFDGWFALKKRLAEPGAPHLTKRVFPGIELRLVAPADFRLNAHVLFSDEVDDQILNDFKSALTLELISRPLSRASLIKYARKVGEDKVIKHGFRKIEVDCDDEKAFLLGSHIAELNCDSYKQAIIKVPDNLAVGFMPFDTNDGLDHVKHMEHYAYCVGLFKASPIFETRKPDLQAAFVGVKTDGNDEWFERFQDTLGFIPRLAVSGSDAHCFIGTPGDNNKRGYGDFPSSKITWIKADPTWRGLLHAIKEPAKRSYIGIEPPKLTEVNQNKTYFIDRLEVVRNESSSLSAIWLDGCNLPLNSDLVAIIGNKGSGKSALADIISLLGNSSKNKQFSFLKEGRFLGKSGEPAKHFVGILTWRDSSREEKNLSDAPSEDKVELVRYIPQGYFEELCNDHVNRRSEAFEDELRAVIFAHANDSIRLGALDFDQLIEQQEGAYRTRLNEARKNLKRINQDIVSIEEQLRPEIRRSLQELKKLKEKQIEEHIKIKPNPVSIPSERLTPAQKESADKLEKVAVALKANEESKKTRANSDALLAGKLKAIQNVHERLRLLNRQFEQFRDETDSDLKLLGMQFSELAALTVNLEPLKVLKETIPQQQKELALVSEECAHEREKLIQQQVALKAELNEPQLRYQQYLKEFQTWEERLSILKGSPEIPETLRGIQARLKQLDELPGQLHRKDQDRFSLTGEIFDILDAQRNARADLFHPVQELIQTNSLIRDEYKLQFQATLGGSSKIFTDTLFDLIKQDSGELRGRDESFSLVQKTFEKYDLNKKDDTLAFVKELHTKICDAARSRNAAIIGISSLIRKDKSAADVYDLVFGLSFMEPRYTLIFQDTQIEQLSPGQRGALLLIFYLLVDNGHNPIVLDQPEENLDNETVVSLLVPVISEAKKKRQIIMVTHNPNLAVVCDAEQIVFSSFNRKAGMQIEYFSGSIENPEINEYVVNVLEGTMPAFNNRGGKYYKVAD